MTHGIVIAYTLLEERVALGRELDVDNGPENDDVDAPAGEEVLLARVAGSCLRAEVR